MGLLRPLALNSKGQLVVVSNRGACTFKETSHGIQATPSVSGLVTAVEPVITQEGGAWVAWGGRYGKEHETLGVSLPMPEKDPKYVLHEVLLTHEEVSLYYDGFSNGCLWPLCHNFIEKVSFSEEQWKAYSRVNQKYAEVVLKISSSHDFIWVHDYQLARVPGFIRRHRRWANISFFWHIPCPPAEIFAILPWAKEYISGMLDADLIGFHTKTYERNFLQAAKEIVGAEVDYLSGTVHWQGRKIKVIAVPIGINWREFERLACSDEVMEKAAQIRGASGGQYMLLGVDRLDYTKGILERLKAISWLLENYPAYRGKLTFIQIAVPSRTGTNTYQQLKRQIEETVGRINGAFTENYHVPVKYIFKPLLKKELVAHYLAADIALVTPVKDGLNLVAKEYVISNCRDIGVLLLSPFAGAASQLQDALLANPYDPREMASKIIFGLKMPIAEKKQRLAALNKIVKEQDIFWWWRQFWQNWLPQMVLSKTVASRNVRPEVLCHEPLDSIAGRNAGILGR